jgi:hypothetical protein
VKKGDKASNTVMKISYNPTAKDQFYTKNLKNGTIILRLVFVI